MKTQKPLKQFVDSVGREYVASELNVNKQSIYFWLCRESGEKNHHRGISKENGKKLVALAEKHQFKGFDLLYLMQL